MVDRPEKTCKCCGKKWQWMDLCAKCGDLLPPEYTFTQLLNVRAYRGRNRKSPEYELARYLPRDWLWQAVMLDRWIADFFHAYSGTIVEVDGSEHRQPEHLAQDKAKEAAYLSAGYRVHRFRNHIVKTEGQHIARLLVETYGTRGRL